MIMRHVEDLRTLCVPNETTTVASYVKKLWSAVPNINSLIRKPTTLSRTN